MNRKKETIWLVATVIFATCLTVSALSTIVTHPWCAIPAINADAAKNDLTYLFQSMYGKGIWFTAMNYPYGEHLVYTDAQPTLCMLLGIFKNVTAGEALTALWWLTGLSYILAIVFTCKILLSFRVRHLFAMAFAGLICIFMPQVFCMGGHYAMGYLCIIPMLFLWTIKYHSNAGWKYPAYVFLMGCIMSFMHPYFAAMILIWVTAYGGGYFIFTRRPFLQRVRHVVPMLIGTICFFAVFTVIMKMTDPVTDRPKTPYGTLTYCTHIKDIISSNTSPIWSFARDKGIFSKASDGGEGYSYLGFAVMIVLFISLVVGIERIKSKNTEQIVQERDFSPVWLFIAACSLILSMGIPFIWHMEWLLDYFSAFRQFRTLGRFIWIFYYITTVYAVVVVCRWHERAIEKGNQIKGYALLLSFFLLWSFEAGGYIKLLRGLAAGSERNYEEFFSVNKPGWQQFLRDHKYEKDSFQAIVVLPFFHIGTEKLWIGEEAGMTIETSSEAVMQIQLPMVDVQMSRSSWGQAGKQVKLVAGPFVHKPLLDDIKSEKPFLLICIRGDSLSEGEKYLVRAADYIGDFQSSSIYALSPSRLRAMDKMCRDSVIAIAKRFGTGDTCVAGDGSFWFVNHFDKADTTCERLFGSGAAGYIIADSSVVASLPVSAKSLNKLYEFSCWFLLGNKDYRSPDFFIQQVDGDGKIISVKKILTKESTDNNGMWFRMSGYIRMLSGCAKINCMLMNVPKPTYISMDELMLRPADAVIISRSADGSLVVNNHLFKQ